jgi:hypothetical protein
MKIKNEKTMEDFIEMEKLELRYYAEEHVTPHEEAYLWHLENPQTGMVLEDQGKIIAFMDLLPVKQNVFEGIKSGIFNDKYLTTDDMVKMDQLNPGDRINLLLSCVVVEESYRKTEALDMLLKAHLNYYLSYVEKGIVIDSVITSNVTKQGEKFSEKMGFRRLGISEHKTVIYLISFFDFTVRIKKGLHT